MLSSSYTDWTIEASASPLLTIHGLEDEYDSARILSVGVGVVQELLLEEYQHDPHRERPEAADFGVSQPTGIGRGGVKTFLPGRDQLNRPQHRVATKDSGLLNSQARSDLR